jgi:tetratricopeptide (TPR) repeat protein
MGSLRGDASHDEVVDFIERVKETIQREGYGRALAILQEAESRIGPAPPLLVWKGLCMQMDEEGRFELGDAERCFKQVLALDPENVEALLELAWHHENLLDEPAAAEPLFRRALELCRRNSTQALLGLSKVLMETNRVPEAEGLLSNPTSMVVDLETLKDKRSRPLG